jgi:hypothetical protein
VLTPIEARRVSEELATFAERHGATAPEAYGEAIDRSNQGVGRKIHVLPGARERPAT